MEASSPVCIFYNIINAICVFIAPISPYQKKRKRVVDYLSSVAIWDAHVQSKGDTKMSLYLHFSRGGDDQTNSSFWLK